MLLQKPDIIARLQREILSLQGFRNIPGHYTDDLGLGPIMNAFPNNVFPTGAIHEFICKAKEASAATCGFTSGILASLMRNGGASLWICSKRTLFPPALSSFGIAPEKIIFIELNRERDVLWATEEALKCSSLSAVVAELPSLDFTSSRRLQLAVEQSRATGFIFRNNPRQLNTTASVARWMITPLPGISEDGLPGVGFPAWNVSLLKIRNGKPGSWQIMWDNERFRHIYPLTGMIEEQERKIG